MTEQIGDDERPRVTEEEIMAAMSVNSVPDEVRTRSSNADETEQFVDGEGNLRRASATGSGAIKSQPHAADDPNG